MRRFLRASLTSHGFRLVEAAHGQGGAGAGHEPQPGGHPARPGAPRRATGWSWLASIRGWSRVPIIVISARGREADKVEALDAGADDYLTKPFGVNELLARIRVALRACDDAAASATPAIEIGPLRIDLARREVTVDGRDVHLTPIEYRLLTLLAQNAGRVLTQRQILEEVWGRGHAGQTHYLRVYMAQLRRKIESRPRPAAVPGHRARRRLPTARPSRRPTHSRYALTERRGSRTVTKALHPAAVPPFQPQQPEHWERQG